MVRTNENGHPIPPEDVDVDEDSYAVAIHKDGQTIFKFEQPSPLRSEPEWKERDHFEHEEVPRMNLRNAVMDYEPSNGDLAVVWVITDELQADGSNPPSGSPESLPESSFNTSQKFVVAFGDGARFDDSQQKNVMGKAVDHLVEEYGLTGLVEIPYMSGYKNALINDAPEHPDGDEMRSSYKLSTGHHLHTHLSGDQKKKYITDLSDACGVEVDFYGQW